MTELESRLSAPGPKRMLALDGGGVRGAISIGFLARLETLLAERSDDPAGFRLCDYFDLIGGTSTGAILATLLALGRSVEDAKPLYMNLAGNVFRRSIWRLPGLLPRFRTEPLMDRIRAEVADLTLGSPELRTGLAIVMKRLDTGSPWVVTNNPKGRFYADPPDGSFIGNKHYPLATLVRASTAAPHYFEPELLDILDGEPPGLFADGGVSPHNSPSLLLLTLAGMKGYGFSWQLGADDLLLASIGTGTFRTQISPDAGRRMPAIELAVRSLTGLISDGQDQALTLLQWLARTDTPWPINSEIGDLAGEQPTEKHLLTFQRYDVRLDRDWLADELDVTVDDVLLRRLRSIDDPGVIPDLVRLGELAAERQVRAEHFPKGFDPAP